MHLYSNIKMHRHRTVGSVHGGWWMETSSRMAEGRHRYAKLATGARAAGTSAVVPR